MHLISEVYRFSDKLQQLCYTILNKELNSHLETHIVVIFEFDF